MSFSSLRAKDSARNITIRDVAQLAGVSQSTVSRVLNKTTSTIAISHETHIKVFAAVEQLGYHPNLTARSLRTQKSQLIAVMIADISNPFYHSIARTIQDIAASHNYDVLIYNTDHLQPYEQRFYDMMMRRPVDGIVLVPYHLTDLDIDRLLRRTGAAIAVLGRHIEHPGIDVVSADDEQETHKAVSWLIHQKGHRRIGFIGVSPTFSVSIRRERGYRRALTEAGIASETTWLEVGDFTHESGYRAMQQFIATPAEARITAVFACNDTMAIGALNATLDAGLHIPDDIAIVGFDNVSTASLVRPTLTTVAQYPVEIGRHLAEALFERIGGQVINEGRRYDVACELLVRQST